MGFEKIVKYTKAYLTYSEITGTKASIEEIKNDIIGIDLYEALYILSQFLNLDEKSKHQLSENLKQYAINPSNIVKMEPIDISNVLYAIKWFLAYGVTNPYYINNNFSKPFNIFMTILKISDHIKDDLEPQDTILRGSLFNRNTEVGSSIIHQYAIFNILAKDKEQFSTEYIDIHKKFQGKYGYSIQEYIAILFALNRDCIAGRSLVELNSQNHWGIDPDVFFEKLSLKEKGKEILKEMCVNPLQLRKWARNTIDNPYDYDVLLKTPFFACPSNKALPSSPAILNAAIYDGLFFKIRECYPSNSQAPFDFFGRLFENYVSGILESSVKKSKLPYKFIPEFSYDKDNKRSSDAYIRLGNSLLIVECKSARITRETKIEPLSQKADKDFEKVVIKPIRQSNERYKEIIKLETNPFNGVKKVYILSVSSECFPKIPKLHEQLKNKDLLELHQTVKCVDYIGLAEIELFTYILEEFNTSIFKFLEQKLSGSYEYIPYQNYYYDKYGPYKRSNHLEQLLKQALNDILQTTSFIN